MRNRFHSLCPYFAMFPESLAEKWIGRLTKPGDYVVDPFCGRGTSPFQALLMDRKAIACDVNDVAYCITSAKTNAPNVSFVKRRVSQLENKFEPEEFEKDRLQLPKFFRHAYSPQTLRQILFLRKNLNWKQSNIDCMIAALVLGSLHGESRSTSYFSNQMPRTISTRQDYSVRFWDSRGLKPPKRNVFGVLRGRLKYRYESDPPKGQANIFHADMRKLPSLLEIKPGPIKCVITSPPYLNVTSFEEDQWLRLWFLGREPRPTYKKVSRDDRYINANSYWDLISDMWRTLGLILDKNAHIVIRMGGKRLTPKKISDGLLGTSVFSKRKVQLVSQKSGEINNKQTTIFRPGAKGCLFEVDCHFKMI